MCEWTRVVNWLYDGKTATEDRDLVNACIHAAIHDAFCEALTTIVIEQHPSRAEHASIKNLITKVVEEHENQGGANAAAIISLVEKSIHLDLQ